MREAITIRSFIGGNICPSNTVTVIFDTCIKRRTSNRSHHLYIFVPFTDRPSWSSRYILHFYMIKTRSKIIKSIRKLPSNTIIYTILIRISSSSFYICYTNRSRVCRSFTSKLYYSSKGTNRSISFRDSLLYGICMRWVTFSMCSSSMYSIGNTILWIVTGNSSLSIINPRLILSYC